MAQKYSLFSYKKGNSFLHKCPAWIKILFIPFVNIIFLCLPSYCSVILIVVQLVLALFLKFSIKEQYYDLRPVIYYGVLLFIMQFLLWIFSGFSETFIERFCWENQKATVFMLVKILAVMQSASLMFKTSTSLEMREGIGKIFGQKSVITNTLFLFLNFIPMVSKIWDQSKKAWLARGGKRNIKMYVVLLPVLFSVGFKKAYNAARAISIRS